MKYVARAKINLALHVTDQRTDGYHLLDSLVCFAEFGDRLAFSKTQQNNENATLEITGPFAAGLSNGKDNLIIKAANALSHSFDEIGVACPPVHLRLEKNLPLASGIGGGSADAATTLVMLKDFWGKNSPINLKKIAQTLGADVAMCLNAQPKRVCGVGEKLSDFPLKISLPLLIVNPGVGLSTPEVFAALDEKTNKPMDISNNIGRFDIASVVDMLVPLRNDLELPALKLEPKIGDVLDCIGTQNGCLLARMSGSGATCFGIFDNEENCDLALANINRDKSHWWLKSTRTIAMQEKLL